MKSSSLTMVFVVHAGELEIKSAVLAASLRKRFGFSMDIIAACPSGKADWGVPSDASRRLYERLGIPLLPMDSPFGPEYPIGNKFAALALGPAVGHTLFLDSDMICVDAFEADMLCRFDAALKPADMALVAKQNDYWERIYAHAGSALPGDRVVTTCSGKRCLRTITLALSWYVMPGVSPKSGTGSPNASMRIR